MFFYLTSFFIHCISCSCNLSSCFTCFSNVFRTFLTCRILSVNNFRFKFFCYNFVFNTVFSNHFFRRLFSNRSICLIYCINSSHFDNIITFLHVSYFIFSCYFNNSISSICYNRLSNMFFYLTSFFIHCISCSCNLSSCFTCFSNVVRTFFTCRIFCINDFRFKFFCYNFVFSTNTNNFIHRGCNFRFTVMRNSYCKLIINRNSIVNMYIRIYIIR